MKSLLNSLHYFRLLENCGNCQKMQYATAVAYQFKTNKPIYYPDRHIEMQRIKAQQKSELVAESKATRHLPKDYYYRLLGLHKHATTQEIKTAYYGLAKRFHPDSTNSSNAQSVSKRFQEISNAYQILTDETKRLEYDQLGEVNDEQTFLEKVNRKKTGTEYKLTAANVLRKFTGVGQSAMESTSMPSISNKDIRLMVNAEQKLEMSFLESVHGVKRNIDLKYLKKCPQCNGTSQRLAGRTSSEPCRKCNGSGQLKKKTATYTEITVCDQCHGKRYINRNQCELCESRGFVQESIKITIHVPAGVKAGDIISVENPKTKQKLTYRVNVNESDYYQRMGNNVITEKYINLSEAILGGTVKVRGIYDSLDMKIEPGTESHTRITLKGNGIKYRGDVGDHVVLVKVRIPRNLTMKQRQLILALAKTENPTFDRTV